MGPLGLAIFYPGTKFGVETLIDTEIMAQNRNRHLGFSKILFLSTGTPCAADFPSHYQIWCKNVYRRRNYGRKSKCKMAAVRHHGFSKIRLLNTGTPWAGDFPSLYQIWRKNVDRRRNYGRKSKSKMAAVPYIIKACL